MFINAKGKSIKIQQGVRLLEASLYFYFLYFSFVACRNLITLNTMNKLLDLVECGAGAKMMCGGIAELLDRKIRDALAEDSPPIPSTIEISKDSDSDDDGSVSLLSEEDAARGSAKYRNTIMTYACQERRRRGDENDENHDLHFLEMEESSYEKAGYGKMKEKKFRNDGSLACSSFDSRTGDTRVMSLHEKKEDTDDDSTLFSDGSSYSSYYFRRGNQNMRSLVPEKATTSWQTISTRATAKKRNSHLHSFHSYDEV